MKRIIILFGFCSILLFSCKKDSFNNLELDTKATEAVQSKDTVYISMDASRCTEPYVPDATKSYEWRNTYGGGVDFKFKFEGDIVKYTVTDIIPPGLSGTTGYVAQLKASGNYTPRCGSYSTFSNSNIVRLTETTYNLTPSNSQQYKKYSVSLQFRAYYIYRRTSTSTPTSLQFDSPVYKFSN